MRYRSLSDCVKDLEKHGHLLRLDVDVDPYLEAAEIHRRVYAKQGPAILFSNLRGTKFSAVSNLFGTTERCHFMFRSTMEGVRRIIALKSQPDDLLKRPWRYWQTPFRALASLPKKCSNGPVFQCETSISELPPITSWPMDGGPFITLPQVYTEDPHKRGPMNANIGMYRVQMSGNSYLPDRQMGLHYQIHRGIGIHHAKALSKGEPLRVSIFVGGPPAHTVAAMMPLPEGLSEALFAGMLAGRRMRLAMRDGHRVAVDSDFCIVGTIESHTLPEGPFGDHLGYYSLAHEFPVLRVEKIYHRPDAIWPFTVVGRPPQEDTGFGNLVHDLTGPAVSAELPGVKALHAVDAAGVHPLLLALGSERYVPYQKRQPQEILTIANAILGFGQCSLAKYLMIAACEDNPAMDLHDIKAYFLHVLARVDWRRDLHFQTQTTIDTLDYSGTGLNSGSKVVMACAGDVKRQLGQHAPNISGAKLVAPGILACSFKAFSSYENAQTEVEAFCQGLAQERLEAFPLIVLVDDAAFCAQNFENFLWITFTRSNPSHDIYGVRSFVHFKHWGCEGPLVIDARSKPHHAPELKSDPMVAKRVDELFASHPLLSKL